MAEESQTGICSGSWWNSARSGFVGSTVSCSTVIGEIGGGFGWTAAEMMESKSRSCNESVSSSSVNFRDAHKIESSDQMVGGGFVDSMPPMVGFGLSSPPIDWNQSLFRSSTGRAESSFHPMLQEDLSSRLYYQQHDTSVEDSSTYPFKNMNQSFLLDQQHLNSGNESGNSFPLVPASYGCPSTLLQGLFEPESKPQPVNYESSMTYRGGSSELLQSSWAKFPQFLKASPPKQQQQPTNQLHFSNDTQFWNASAAAVNEVPSGVYPSSHNQFVTQTFEEKPNCSNVTVKPNSAGARDSCSSSKKSGSEPSFKKPRIETPSPLPTFKVRKEKLGDRITALQQLVSPFGKTDTASVLHEAIDHIKFLHDHVRALSTPYLKHGPSMQQQQKDADGPKQDLRSRGLCLVPVTSTYPFAIETTTDFWTPTFGGSYR